MVAWGIAVGLVYTYLICLDILSPEERVCPKGIGLILKAYKQLSIVSSNKIS